jgi:hypothetical protein
MEIPTPALGTDPLVPVQEDGKLLRTRLKDAAAGRAVYERMRKADEGSARTRTMIQAMLDGEPPYDQQDLERQGLGELCNVNWGQGEQLLSVATSPYIDLLESVDIFITTPVNFGDVQMRAEWETIISEEFTRMLRNWPEFFPRYLYLIQQFLAHGVVVAFHDDDIDWRPQVAPLGDFLIPRQTRASDEEIEVCSIVRGVPPHELFAKIEDEVLAKDLGWKIEATKKAIIQASQKSIHDNSISNWEAIQREFKNNDIGFSNSSSAAEVKLVYMWVRELDGTVSQYIFTEKVGDTGEGKEFLFESRHKYQSTAEAFTSFFYGIGTNGYFHSIRGLGSKIFSIVQALNRLRNRFFDGLLASSMMMIEPDSEDALQDLSLIHIGPFLVKPPNVKMLETNAPNYGNSLIPGLNELNNLLQQQGGTYSTEAIFNAAKERTRYEVQAQVESLSNINIAALTLFYQPWERLLKEILRRISRQDYFAQDAGGRYVINFRERCLDRGVPEEALYAIDTKRAKVVRAIGNGSSAARSAIMQQVYNLSQNFDAQGRQMAIRDLTRTIGGVEAADRYAPAPEQQRPPMEAKTAMLENNQLKQGEAIEVLPTEMHAIHLPIHLQVEEELIQAIDEGQVTIEEVMPILTLLHQHSSAHAEMMTADPNYPQIKQRMQQIDEIIWNGTKRLEKLLREQQEQGGTPEQQAAAAAPNAANPSDAPDTMQRQLVEMTTKLRMAEEKHAQEMRIRDDQARQSMAIADAEAAAKILRANRTP